MRVVLLQYPMPGRESPASSLARALAVPRVDFGDLMRAHLTRATELGVRAAEFINAGMPLPDEIGTAVVRGAVQHAPSASFLLAGHPRNVAQALALDDLLHEQGLPLDVVLCSRISEEEVERHVQDLAARRACRNDPRHGCVPSVDTLVAEGLCNLCGGELYQREEDNEDSVRRRFASYGALTESVLRHYAEQDLLVTVDAVGTHGRGARRRIPWNSPSTLG